MREAGPDGKRLRATNGMARWDGGSCQQPNWMPTRPAQPVERPNGRRCQCSESRHARGVPSARRRGCGRPASEGIQKKSNGPLKAARCDQAASSRRSRAFT
jgi:hypothetical protein